ncbi:hypothetical protein GCM10023175_42170 [Pseudonocardia xishanensis]|uniref:Uncharacterized protein n=1 Tax=Pseudonocardia xishanensis TaxID=630995 RepID=A0ABP8RWD2_9PSEU
MGSTCGLRSRGCGSGGGAYRIRTHDELKAAGPGEREDAWGGRVSGDGRLPVSGGGQTTIGPSATWFGSVTISPPTLMNPALRCAIARSSLMVMAASRGQDRRGWLNQARRSERR